MSMEMNSQPSLKQLFASNDDFYWGEYMFQRDLFSNKCKPEERQQLIQQSITCGKEYAASFFARYGHSFALKNIIDELGLTIHFCEEDVQQHRLLLGQFTTPNEIAIQTKTLQKAYANLKSAEIYVDYEEIVNLVLGHELFHWIEEQEATTIFTRQKKVELWKFFGWSYRTNLSILSEISAMIFTKEINQSLINPCILDIALTTIK